MSGFAPNARADDLVTDWNATLRTVIQLDGASDPAKANPGWRPLGAPGVPDMTGTTTPVDNLRTFSTFTTHIDGTSPDWASPEWEMASSRVYLGIHWRLDATDGIRMGTAIADEIAATAFQVVPEPAAVLPAARGLAVLCWLRRRRGGLPCGNLPAAWH